MSLTTSIVADVGEYTVYLTVSLTDYPGITSITKSIVVKITCEVQTIIFATAPTGTTIILVGIDIQPFIIAFATTQTPACGKTVTFSLSPSRSFLTLQSLAALGGNVQVNEATIADHATYSQTLTATVDSKTATANFDVVIKNPCSAAVFQISPAPLITMNVSMPSVATTT